MTAEPHLLVSETIPMTWEQYLETDVPGRVEYIDGAAVMSPLPTTQHARIVTRLTVLVQSALPEGWECLSNGAWKPGRDEFGPDLMVVPSDMPLDRFSGIPPMVCEVVSQNRSDDLVRKMQKYPRLGVPQYWIFDPRDREAFALRLQGDTYEEYARVDAEHRTAHFIIPVGEGIEVSVEYDRFF